MWVEAKKKSTKRKTERKQKVMTMNRKKFTQEKIQK